MIEAGGRFEPTDDPKLARLLAKARRFNEKLDGIDDAGTFAKPSSCPLDLHLQTVLTALFCGMSTRNWDTVAEGVAMLQDAELRIRT